MQFIYVFLVFDHLSQLLCFLNHQYVYCVLHWVLYLHPLVIICLFCSAMSLFFDHITHLLCLLVHQLYHYFLQYVLLYLVLMGYFYFHRCSDYCLLYFHLLMIHCLFCSEMCLVFDNIPQLLCLLNHQSQHYFH